MLDLYSNYIEYRDAGVAKVIKDNDIYYIEYKCFDPVTGKELAPGRREISVQDCCNMRDSSKKMVDNLEAIIKDC